MPEPEERHESPPAKLEEDLRRLHAVDLPVPAELDERILARVRARPRPTRRLRPVWWAAAAAAVLLVAALAGLDPWGREAPRREAPVVARADIDRSGRVDVLDAFALARRIEARAELDPAWDLTGDGRVDRLDVDHVARDAVRIR